MYVVVCAVCMWYVCGMYGCVCCAVQDLEKEGHKAISLQDENPQIYLDDEDVIMGEYSQGRPHCWVQ